HPVGRLPLVPGGDRGVARAVLLRLADPHADDPAVPRGAVLVPRLAPEVDALAGLVGGLDLQLDSFGDDVAVAEPGGLLVRVVGRGVAGGALLDRPGAGDRDVARGEDRPEVRL